MGEFGGLVLGWMCSFPFFFSCDGLWSLRRGDFLSGFGVIAAKAVFAIEPGFTFCFVTPFHSASVAFASFTIVSATFATF